MKNNPELKVLRSERQKQGLSIRDMAKSVGLSKSMYAYLETGDKRLTYDYAVKIGEALGKKPDELFVRDYKEYYRCCVK